MNCVYLQMTSYPDYMDGQFLHIHESGVVRQVHTVATPTRKNNVKGASQGGNQTYDTLLTRQSALQKAVYDTTQYKAKVCTCCH